MGFRVLLVSGRPYSTLGVMAQKFGTLDGIVAENGAIVEAPLGTAPTVTGRRVARSVRARIRGQSRLHPDVGEIVISVPRSMRRRLEAAVAGLPVQLVPNVDRLMVVPDGVSKRSGMRTALRQLGIAHGRYAAIGDAENDVALLEGARLAGAVANAEPNVLAAVDYVCRERFERGVLEFVRGPLARLR